MLGGRISNQDEEEVEEELAALEAKVAVRDPAKAEDLPSVPDAQLPAAQREEAAEAKQPERQALAA